MTNWTPERVAALLEPLTGYTPGPWFQSTQHGDWGLPGAHFVLASDAQTQVASVEYLTPYCAGASRKERSDAALADANARLIAAAPDLVDALRAALDRAAELTVERDAAVEWAEKAEAEVVAMRNDGSWFKESDIDRLMAERDAAVARAEMTEDASKRLRDFARWYLMQWFTIGWHGDQPVKAPHRDLIEDQGKRACAALAQDHSALDPCATEGCPNRARITVDRGGVASRYCANCYVKIDWEKECEK